MRTTLFALALLLSHAAGATTFVIGNEPFGIFRNGCWAYCHPAVFESVTK